MGFLCHALTGEVVSNILHVCLFAAMARNRAGHFVTAIDRAMLAEMLAN
jgi:hypothetical protein